jgi:hypothetical protein
MKRADAFDSTPINATRRPDRQGPGVPQPPGQPTIKFPGRQALIGLGTSAADVGGAPPVGQVTANRGAQVRLCGSKAPRCAQGL